MATRRRAATREGIKWIRLQRICLDLADPGIDLHIHGSTDVPPDLMAAVERDGSRIDILMNLLYNKTLEDVIDSLAHEMAHIVLNTEGHDGEFDKMWIKLRKRITRDYRALGCLAKAKGLAELHLARHADKAGKPKLGHAERVAAKCESAGDKTVAYLHDLLEDTDYTSDQLERDFPPRIAAAVLAMTRTDKHEDYMAYVRRLAVNPLARRIKLKDLEDNLDPTRVMPDEAEQKALKERYERAREFLLAFT